MVVLFVQTDKLSSFPLELEADDIEDFCSLALYYESRTPQSFRQVGPSNQTLVVCEIFDVFVVFLHRKTSVTYVPFYVS